jgi:hypothetical protein
VAPQIDLSSAWGVAVGAGSEVTESSAFGAPLKLCGDQITLTSGSETFTVKLTCKDITFEDFADYVDESAFPNAFPKCLAEPGKKSCTLIEVSGVPANFDETVLVERIFVPFVEFDAGDDGVYGTADDLVKDPGILYSHTGGTDAFSENILTDLADAIIDEIDPTRMTGSRDDFGSELLFCEDCNGAPRFVPPLEDQTVIADPVTGTAFVTIDATVLDLGPLTYEWALLDGPGGNVVEIIGTSEDLIDYELSYGIHYLRLLATDSGARQRNNSDEVKITVVDAVAPVVSDVLANPSVMWPPNHEFVPVTLTVAATDNFDVPMCRVVDITHSENTNGTGDGDTDPDWDFSSASTFQEGPLTVLMRAERAEAGTGRTYTVTVDCADSFGNISDPLTKDVVSVQDDQGGE